MNPGTVVPNQSDSRPLASLPTTHVSHQKHKTRRPARVEDTHSFGVSSLTLARSPPTIVGRDCANANPEKLHSKRLNPPLIQAGFSMGGDFLNSENTLDWRLHIPGQQQYTWLARVSRCLVRRARARGWLGGGGHDSPSALGRCIPPWRCTRRGRAAARPGLVQKSARGSGAFGRNRRAF